MKINRNKILKYIIISLLFFLISLTTNTLYAATKKQLQSNKITIPQSSYTYTGKEIKPVPTVKYKGTLLTKTLTQNEDYTVSYKYNTNITSDQYGNLAEVIIKGKGDYTGTVKKYFTIKPIDINNCTIKLSDYTYTYNSKPKKPTAYVYNQSGNFIGTSNYYVTYKNNVSSGTASATVTGLGNYAGSKTVKFTIEKRQISSAYIELLQNTFTYDSTAKKPQIKSIKIWADNEYKTIASKYYTVSYKNYINPGTASVIITGTGNFKGETKINYTINKRYIDTAEVKLSQDTFTYDSTAKKPKLNSIKIRTSAGSLKTVSSKYYELSYKNNKNAGTASVIITGKGKFKGTKTVKYIINKRDINTASITLNGTSFTYDGTAKKPSLRSIQIDTPNGKKTVSSNYYSVSYRNNINPGTAYMVIEGKGNFKGTTTINFTINYGSTVTPRNLAMFSSIVYADLQKIPEYSITMDKNIKNLTFKDTCMVTDNQLKNLSIDINSLVCPVTKDKNTNAYSFLFSNFASTDEVKNWTIVNYYSVNTIPLINGTAKFTAMTFKRGNNIVIAYRATDADIGDIYQDICYGLFGVAGQESYAIDYALAVAKQYPSSNIYITGWSLGGYLAQFGGAALVSNPTHANRVKGIMYFNGIGLDFWSNLNTSSIDNLDINNETLKKTLKGILNSNKFKNYVTNTSSSQKDTFNILNNWYKNGGKLVSFYMNGDIISALGSHAGSKIGYSPDISRINHYITIKDTNPPSILKIIQLISAKQFLQGLDPLLNTTIYNYVGTYKVRDLVDYFWITHELDSFFIYL